MKPFDGVHLRAYHSDSLRQIGPWGTAARIIVGAGLIMWAIVTGPSWPSVVLGLVVFPGAVILLLLARGRVAKPLRMTGPEGHAAFVTLPVPAMFFYGSSMLLAAIRGYAGCDLFAVSNWLRGRRDEIGCPVFWPVDTVEAQKRQDA